MRAWRRLLRQGRSRAHALAVPQSIPAGHLVFVCNICGASTSADLARVVDREVPTCSECKSSIRFRSLVAALQERLFDNVTPLKDLPGRKELEGLGLSDDPVYSRFLEEKFNYINTFYDGEPCLDITDPSPHYLHRFDFVISSDVMEHVAPPVEVAFRNLHSLLRPSGLLVLTVPFGLQRDTIEHFPGLHKFEILGRGKDRYLVNITRDGERQEFHNLVFHGGRGAPLEMRLFSETTLLKQLQKSGFRDIKIHAGFLPHWGIVNRWRFSLPITAIAG